MSTTRHLRLRSAVLALTGATVALAGCSSATGVSAPSSSSETRRAVDCSSVLIQIRSATLSAPLGHRWAVTVDGGRGSIDAQGGAQAAERWDRDFVVDAGSRAALCSYAVEVAQQDPTDKAGGPTMYAEYTPAGGSRVFGKAGVDAVDSSERLQTLLPSAEWAALQQQLEDWNSTPVTTAAPPTS